MMEKTINRPHWLNRLAEVVAVLHVWCVWWLVATQILPFVYQRVALVCFFVSYGLDYLLSQRWRTFEWKPVKWAFVVMILFFLLQPLYHLFEVTQVPFYYRAFEHRLAFMAFGVLGILGVSPKIKLKPVAVVMLLMSALSVLYLLFVKIGMPQAVLSPERTFLFIPARLQTFGSHMNFNIYLNTSLVFALYLLLYGQRWEKCLSLVSTMIIAYALWITEGRVGFCTGSVLLGVGVLVQSLHSHRRKWAIPVALCLVLVGGAYCIYHFRKVNLEFKGKEVTEDPRKYIWAVACDVLVEEPLLGRGVSDGRNHFVARGMNDREFMQFYGGHYVDSVDGIFVMHPHNMVLSTWIEYGIVGVSLLAAMFLIPLLLTQRPNRLYVWLFTFAYVFQGMFEIIGSNLTPLLWGIFIVLLVDVKMNDYREGDGRAEGLLCR